MENFNRVRVWFQDGATGIMLISADEDIPSAIAAWCELYDADADVLDYQIVEGICDGEIPRL